MMMNQFSDLDPTSSLFMLPLNWMSTVLGILFLLMLFWAMPSGWSFLWTLLTSNLH